MELNCSHTTSSFLHFDFQFSIVIFSSDDIQHMSRVVSDNSVTCHQIIRCHKLQEHTAYHNRQANINFKYNKLSYGIDNRVTGV
jgi:hypothetical protein